MLRTSSEENSVKPSRQATDEEFLRRAYLDVLGRIPYINEANAFLKSKDAGKRSKLVEYLLSHPDYPKNFATVWKVALLGRKNQPRDVDANALTAWLRRQFLENRPWNEMAFDLIDAKGSNKENGAVNFTLAHMADNAVNLTSVTTRVFLGQQIQCTQCHDHPSNDWKQSDFWGINAFYKGLKLSGSEQGQRQAGTVMVDHIEIRDEPSDKWSTYERRDAKLGIAFPTFLDGRKISQKKDVDRREALAKFVTEPATHLFRQGLCEPALGTFLRPRLRRAGRRLRAPQPAESSGASRKARSGVQGRRIRHQGLDPLDHEQRGL